MPTLLLLSLGLLIVTPYATLSALSSSNYTGLKNFMQGLLSGYSGASVVLPEDCLPPTAQSKLDEDLVSLLTESLRLDFSSVESSLEALRKDLGAMSATCGLDVISENYSVELKKNGVYWILVSLFWHLFDIQASASKFLEDLVLENWEAAGQAAGQTIEYVVPAESSVELSPGEGIYFVQGLLSGLLADPSKPNACYNELSVNVQAGGTVVDDVFRCLGGDVMALQQLYVDGLNLYTAFNEFAGDECDSAALLSALEGLSIDQLTANFLKNALPLSAQIESLKHCAIDYAACGGAAGSVFRELLGWSLS